MTHSILGTPLSPFTRKVALFACEMGLDIDLKEVNPYFPPDDFEKISPLKQVPVLQMDDFLLSDSSAICAYLNAAHPAKAKLFPKKPNQLGHALWLEEYADTALFSVISNGIFRPIFINEMRGVPADIDTVRRTVAEDLPPVLTYLETQLKDKDWFCGDAFSIADLSVYAQMANLEHSQCLPDPCTFPRLVRHFNAVSGRPVALTLQEKELSYLRQVRAMLAKSAQGK